MKHLLLLALLLTTITIVGQVVANPYSGAIDLSPNSGIDGNQGTFDCGQSMQASFNLGVTGLTDLDADSIPITFTVGITGWEYTGAIAGGDASAFVSGTFSNLFTYIFTNTTTITATQSADIPATGPDPTNPIQGSIEIALNVPESATTGTALGLNINLQVPGYINGNDQNDDNESTSGNVICPDAEISGSVMVTNREDSGPDSTFQGVKIMLLDNGNTVLDSMLTDENGAFKFDGLSPGNYSLIQIQPSGFTDVSDQDASPEDVVDFTDIFTNEAPVNNTIPVLLTESELDIDNNFVEAPAIVVPLVLSAFNVRAKDCTAQLQWTSESEINASHVIVQLSLDGRIFEDVQKVEAIGRANSYTIDIPDLSSGKYFFRLQQVDFDGFTEYSILRSVKVEGCGDNNTIFNIYPNPIISNGYLNVEYNDIDISSFTIYNFVGQIVNTIKVNSIKGINNKTIKMDELTPGSYIIKSNTGMNKLFIITNN